MEVSALRNNFMTDYLEMMRCNRENEREYKLFIIVLELPTKAIQVITTLSHIREQVEYYITNYDDQFVNVFKKDLKVIEYILM